MSNSYDITPPNVRIGYDTVNAYVGPELTPKTFWQKLGAGALKVANFILPVAGGVAGVLGGPIGIGGAFAAYGASQLTQDKLIQLQQKDQIELNSQPKVTSVGFPGLFETAVVPVGQQATEFIAPTSMQPTINEVVINREAMRQEEISQP